MTVISTIPSSMIHGEVRYLAYGHKMKKQHGNETYDWGIPVPPAQGSAGVTGSGGNVAAGDYLLHIIPESFLGRFGNPWAAIADPDPIEVTATSANSVINVTLPIHGDPQVKYMNVYRTRVGELGPFFYAGRVSNGTTTLDLNGNDESLPADDFLEGPSTYAHDESNYAGPFKYGRPPSKHICINGLDDRAIVCGEKEYTDGTISMVAGSLVVNGVGTQWNSTMKNKTVRIADEGLRYEIDTVDSATRLKIKTAYVRPTWKTADPTGEAYILIGDPNAVYVSEPNEPEYFNPIPFEVGKEGGGYITGAVALGNDVLIATESQVFMMRIGYGVSEVEVIKTGSTYGVVSGRSMVAARGSVFFFTGDYICQFYNQNAKPISEKLGDLLVDAVEDMKQYAISVVWNDYILTAFAKDSTEFLDTIVAYNLNTGIWDVWDGFEIVDMQTIVTEEGQQYVYFISPAGNGYTLNTFAEWCLNDGMGVQDYSGNVLYSTSNTVGVDATLPQSGAGLLGTMIRIESGRGVGQERYIYTNSAGTITVNPAWVTQPDFSSKYTIGAIKTWMRSGETSPDAQVRHQFKEIELRLGEENDS